LTTKVAERTNEPPETAVFHFREIPLVNSALVALGDAGDYKGLVAYRWLVMRTRDPNLTYAYRKESGKTVPMHRHILGLQYRHQEADHINRNGLDNRRSNLRVVTHAQNMQNQKAPRHGKSPHRGVQWSKSHQRWAAVVTLNGRRYRLGRFKDDAEAGRVAATFRRNNMPFATE